VIWVKGWFGRRLRRGGRGVCATGRRERRGLLHALEGDLAADAVLPAVIACRGAGEGESVEVRAEVVGRTVIASKTDLSTNLAELLQLVERSLYVAAIDRGVATERAHGGPGAAVAVVVGDAEEDELGRAGGS
jgi:hypothetical protein